MARNNDRDRGKRGAKDAGRRTGKKKVDIIARDQIAWVDYKDVNLLRKFMSDRGKIRARRVSGLSTQHQRAVATAIKTARELALLPYSQRTVTERGGTGGRRPRRGEGGAVPVAETEAAPEELAELEGVDVTAEVDVDGDGAGEGTLA